jgi:putative tryptophan/tyrosine transport system substrate-binding protein
MTVIPRWKYFIFGGSSNEAAGFHHAARWLGSCIFRLLATRGARAAAWLGAADRDSDGLREAIIALAARHRVPAVYPYRFFVKAGGLLAYGIDLPDLERRAAAYADRILKGMKPADLPVQLPVKFELAVNLKTANALGVSVPPNLLALADEVIE